MSELPAAPFAAPSILPGVAADDAFVDAALAQAREATAHGEILALREAAGTLGRWRLLDEPRLRPQAR